MIWLFYIYITSVIQNSMDDHALRSYCDLQSRADTEIEIKEFIFHDATSSALVLVLTAFVAFESELARAESLNQVF